MAYREVLWISHPAARHLRNVAKRPEAAIEIFDSTVAIGRAEAVYFDAFAEEVGEPDLERTIKAYSSRRLR